jgi:hypothetical protein
MTRNLQKKEAKSFLEKLGAKDITASILSRGKLNEKQTVLEPKFISILNP